VKDDFVTIARNGDIEVLFSIRNEGQTPAYEVYSWTGMVIDEMPELAVFRRPEVKPTHPITLHKNDAHKIPIFGINLTPEELKIWKEGKVTLFCYGEVMYEDAFGQKHWTRFSYMATGLQNRMETTATGNETDRDFVH
jgi:hypothetical protein